MDLTYFKMPLPRPCARCGKKFTPNGSGGERLCLECWKKAHEERIKRSKFYRRKK